MAQPTNPLLALAAQAPAAPAPAAPAPVQAPSPIPTAAPNLGGETRFMINGVPVPSNVWQAYVDAQKAAAQVAPNQVNPPEFQPPPLAAPAPAPAPTPAPTPAPMDVTNPLPAPVSPVAVSSEQSPRKRGRPPGSKNKATLEKEASAAQTAPALPQTLTPVASVAGCGTLFINYAEGDAHAKRTADMFAAANKMVCDAENAPPLTPDHKTVLDYRMARYGTGPGMLAAAMASLWTSGDLYIDLRTHEGAACAMTLAAKASRVLWGS